MEIQKPTPTPSRYCFVHKTRDPPPHAGILLPCSFEPQPATSSVIVDPKGEPARLVQPIRIRPARDTDMAFVFQTWLKDFKSGPLARSMDPRIYNHEQARVIQRLVKESPLVIACDEEEEDTILGWGCGELWRDAMQDDLTGEPIEPSVSGAVVHYLYVSMNFRRRAIAARLLEHLVGEDAIAGRIPLFYSHLPEPRHIDGRMVPNVAITMAKAPQYNPFLAFTR